MKGLLAELGEEVSAFRVEFGAFSGAAYVFDIACLTSCPSGLSKDGIVDSADLALLLGAWGSACGVPAAQRVCVEH